MGERHPDVAASLNDLGSVYGFLGDYTRSIELFNQSLEIRKEIFGESHQNIATSLNALGVAYYDMKDNTTASKYCTESVAMFSDIYGEDHPFVQSLKQPGTSVENPTVDDRDQDYCRIS